MQKWEYKVMDVEKAFYSSRAETVLETMLNDLGKDGWELVGYVTFNVHKLAFKRQISAE